MNKYSKEIENIRKRIKENPNPLYRKAALGCLNDIEKILNSKDNELPSNLSSSFDAYLTHSYVKEQRKSELDILFNMFMNNYIDLIRNFELNDVLEIYCFFRICLYDGVLSSTYNFETDTKDNNAIPNEKHIATGVATNNDINKFLVKLYNNLGIEAVSFPCYVLPEKYDTCLEAIQNINTDYENETTNITIASEGEQLILIDHMNKEFAYKRDTNFFKLPSSGLLVDYSLGNIEEDAKKDMHNLLRMPLLPITEEKFNKSYDKAYTLFYSRLNDINIFRDVNKYLLKRIASYMIPEESKEDLQKLGKKKK